MTRLLKVHPDQWLLCAQAVEQAVRGPWAADIHPESLSALRLRSGQVEFVELERLAERVRSLVEAGCGTLHIVVERMGAQEIACIDDLKKLGGNKVLRVWREAPQDVRGSLSVPEVEVLKAWELRRKQPAVALAGEWSAAYRQAYETALRHWADEVSAADPVGFAAIYAPVSEVTSWAEAVEALASATGATAAAGIRVVTGAAANTAKDIVRLFSLRPGNAVRGHMGLDSFFPAMFTASTDGPSPQPPRTWFFGDDARVTVPHPDCGDNAEVQLRVLASSNVPHMVRCVLVGIGKLPPIEFGGDGGPPDWDTSEGELWLTATVPYTDELKAAVSDELTEVVLELGR